VRPILVGDQKATVPPRRHPEGGERNRGRRLTEHRRPRRTLLTVPRDGGDSAVGAHTSHAVAGNDDVTVAPDVADLIGTIVDLGADE
jgi:hypothetical protein